MEAGSAIDSGGDGCIDLRNDPLNCGACGHDCLGAPCVAGTCGPTPTVLASGQQGPSALAVDATNVYWVNVLPQAAGSAGHSQVMRCAIAGCGNAPSILWDGLYPVDHLAVERGAVWWPTGPGGVVSAPFGQNPNVLTCAVGGCGNAPTSLITSTGVIYAFAVDGARAYWTSVGGNVSSCALTGCGNAPTTVFADSFQSFALAVNSQRVYWADEGRDLQSCPLGGCTGTPTLLGAASPVTSALAADEAHVYWIEQGAAMGGGKLGPVTQYTNGEVLECPIAGCNGSPLVLAQYASWLGGAALAVDATSVYWSSEDGSGTYGEIVRCAIGGCGGKPTPVGATTGRGYGTPGVAVDATHVFWTDRIRGAVMMTAK